METNLNNPNSYRHTHNGTDSPFINNANPTAVTAATVGVLSTGGSAVLQTFDSSVIENMRTRVAEIETQLRRLGFII